MKFAAVLALGLVSAPALAQNVQSQAPSLSTKSCLSVEQGQNFGLLTTAFCLAARGEIQNDINNLRVKNPAFKNTALELLNGVQQAFVAGKSFGFQAQLRSASCIYAISRMSQQNTKDVIPSGKILVNGINTVHDGLAEHIPLEKLNLSGTWNICRGSDKSIQQWQPFQYDWKKRLPAQLPQSPFS